MKNALFSIILLTFFVLPGFSQEQHTSRIEVEVDPIAYALNGYSVHGVYVYKSVRTDLGIFGLQQPESYNGNKGFRVNSGGAGLKVQYLLNERQTWFTGIGIGYGEHTITHAETGQRSMEKTLGLGVNLGYRWFLFAQSKSLLNGLYLSPWASVDYNKVIQSTKFEGLNYSSAAFSIFPTVHIGYKICL